MLNAEWRITASLQHNFSWRTVDGRHSANLLIGEYNLFHSPSTLYRPPAAAGLFSSTVPVHRDASCPGQLPPFQELDLLKVKVKWVLEEQTLAGNWA
jgi:hypothetical protein